MLMSILCSLCSKTVTQSMFLNLNLKVGPFKLSLKVLEILASMPELHVLNMSNNHIQRTTGKCI